MTKGSVVGLVIIGGVVLLVGAALTPLTTNATNVPALGYAELPNGRGGANVEAIVKNVYVEPAIWTIEWARDFYDYPVTRSN